MARLVWTGPALADLKDIVAYIRKDSKVNAKRMGNRIRSAPKQLKKHPKLGGVVSGYETEGLREIIVSPYRIIYRVHDDIVAVIAVAHGSLDLKKKLRRMSDE